MYGR
jgi:hypothetical protein